MLSSVSLSRDLDYLVTITKSENIEAYDKLTGMRSELTDTEKETMIH